MFFQKKKQDSPLSPLGFILNPIRDFMNREKFFVSDISKYESLLNEKHVSWKVQNKIVAKEFIDLVEGDPRSILKIIDNGIEEFKHLYSLRKFDSLNNGDLPSTGEQMEILASLYERLNALKLTAFLLCQRRESFDRINGQEKILKYFKILGFTSTDKKNFRLIRNSVSHIFEIQEDSLILEDGTTITFQEIELLYNKVQELFEYSFSLLKYSILNVPKFTLYTLIVFGNKGEKFTNEHKKIEAGFKLLYPDDSKEESLKKENKLILFFKKIKRKISLWFSKKILFNKLNIDESLILTPSNLVKVKKLLIQTEIEVQESIDKLCQSIGINATDLESEEIDDKYINFFLNSDNVISPLKEGIQKYIEKELKNKTSSE